MPLKKSELYSSLWQSCDELRGGMDASQYKDYVLVLLFVKYVSDMEVKPGYKQTEVGLIPKEWNASPLKGKLGIAHGFPFASEYFADHGSYRLTTPGHFYEAGGFRDIGEKQKFYDGPVPVDYVLRPGDLIVAMTEQADGLLGSAAVIPNAQGYLHNQRLGRVKPLTAEIELSFMFYVFNSPSYRAKVRETAAGTKVKHTSPEKLLEISVPLPPAPEQRAISGALSDVDALLGALDQLIAKKCDLKQAAMQQLLTAKKRLPGFGAVWRTEQLGNAGKITMGQSPPGDSYSSNSSDMPLLNGAVDLTQDGIKVSQYTKAPTRVSKKDDLLFCIRATIGNLQIGDREYCLGRGVAGLTVDTAYDAKFIEYQLKSLFALMNNQSEGGVIKGLRKDDVGKFTISVPNQMAEQTAIAGVLTDMDAELAALEQRRAKTRALKQGMMQELLTGRTRLL